MKNRADIKATPEQICRAALIAMNVPREIVIKISVGPEMDTWVQYVVMDGVPWEKAQKIINSIRATHGKHLCC